MFDFLKAILFNKRHITLTPENESEFSQYMLNRWLSFSNEGIAQIVNSTTNKLLLSTKQEQFDFLFNVIPKIITTRINYIKKTKKDKKEKEDVVVPEFYSKREYMQAMDLAQTLSK